MGSLAPLCPWCVMPRVLFVHGIIKVVEVWSKLQGEVLGQAFSV